MASIVIERYVVWRIENCLVYGNCPSIFNIIFIRIRGLQLFANIMPPIVENVWMNIVFSRCLTVTISNT